MATVSRILLETSRHDVLIKPRGFGVRTTVAGGKKRDDAVMKCDFDLPLIISGFLKGRLFMFLI